MTLRFDSAPLPVSTVSSYMAYLVGHFQIPSQGRRVRFLIAAPLTAIAIGTALPLVGLKVGIGALAMALIATMVWNHPPIAGYSMAAGAPLVVGFNRDQILPLLRPNEALLLALSAVLLLRWLIYSRRISFRLNKLDVVVMMIVITGFILPLLIQLGRLKPVNADDVFYALVFVRIALLYGLIRHTIRTPGQVRATLTLSVVVGMAIGIMGVMDSMNLFGAAEKLVRYFPNGATITNDGRGAATIGNPIGYGVYMAINALIAFAMLLGGEQPRKLLHVAAVVCTAGVFGSGQVGPTGAFFVGVAVLAFTTKSTRSLLRMAPATLLVAVLVLVPLAQRRVEGFSGPAVSSSVREGLASAGGSDEGRNLFEANPGSSWDVRLYNLETYFLPELADATNVLWGVTPQARVVSPRGGEDFIWIESGILWLFWTGGIPLFLTWFALLTVGATVARQRLRQVPGPVGIAAAAALASLATVGSAMAFDPHMTLRGSADLLYPLLALMMTGWGLDRAPNPPTQELPHG